jgi:MFS family permease
VLTDERDLAPLAHRDFRVLCLATVFSGLGFRGQLVVLGWLLLESSDSPLMVGIGLGVMLAPNALFGVLGGAIVDQADRRFLLRILALLMALNSALLGLLVLHSVIIWLVLVLTFTGGTIWSALQTARQSYAYDLVGAGRVLSGLALTNLMQRIGGVAGGAGTGAAIAVWGAGEAYLVLGAAFAVSSAVMLMARSRGQAAPLSRQPVLRNLREYVVELKSNRTLGTLIALTAAVEIFGFSHLSALPVLVRDELGRGGGTLGLMATFSSAGGIAGILIFSARGDQVRKGLTFLAVLCLFGLALVLLGASSSLTVAFVAITLVSGLAALSDVLSQSLVQVSVPNEMRGRAMGSWALAIGMAPIGHLQIGGLAALIGVSSALAANGVALILLALAAGLGLSRLRSL